MKRVYYSKEGCYPQINLDVDPNRPDWASDLFVVFRGCMEPATLVGVDPASDELLILSGRQERAVGMADLLRVIQRGTSGDPERG